MKRIIVLLLIFTGTFTIKVQSQVKLGINISASTLDMIGPYNNYRAGYQGGIGVMVSDELKWIKDLSWESGIMTHYGQTGYYPLKMGSFMIVNNLYPLNTTEKLQHRIWTVDIPVKLKYNGFGFMGLTGGFRFSWLLDGNIYVPSLSQTNRGYKYRKITPLVEGGLFFPVGKKFIIETTAYKAINDRFYTGSTQGANSEERDVGGHSDFGFGVNVAYKLN